MSDKRTIRGQGVAGDVDKIQLFDGLFTTGYRLKRIVITPSDPFSSEEVTVRLLTEDIGHGTSWNWSRNEQIGWACWNTPINSRFGQFDLVDEECIIVEDLYIDFSGDAGQLINYLIEIERVTFSDWKGALAMVQNRSQS